MEWPPVLVGEDVWWLCSGSGLPKKAKVKWIGNLAEIGSGWSVGIELEDELPMGGIDGTWRGRKLFQCKPKHGLIVPIKDVSNFKNSGKTLVPQTDALSKRKRSLDNQLFHGNNAGKLSIYNRPQHQTLPPPRRRKFVNPNYPPIIQNSLQIEENRVVSVILSRDGQNDNILLAERMNKRSCNGKINNNESLENQKKSTGILSFLKWFKRDSKVITVNEEEDEDIVYSNPNSPVLRRFDGSLCGSVDTLFSTATATSFAFVHPSSYRPNINNNGTINRIIQADFVRHNGRLCDSDFNINRLSTLERINYSNETLNRRKRKAPEPPVSYDSLPATLIREPITEELTPHRRTVSELSEYKKKKYHVKGKRKAPPPPLIDNSKISKASNSIKKKKRPAPQPPVINEKEIKKESEILNIVTEAALEIINDEVVQEEENLKYETLSTASTVDVAITELNSLHCTDTLKLDKGILKPKMEKINAEPKAGSSTPVSPRPWYKRNQTKKTLQEKQRKENDRKSVEDWILEGGFPRRSFFNFDNLNKKTGAKINDKRHSQISILTNISELDREAAEIIQRGRMQEKALLASNDAKYYINNVDENLEFPRKNSARELISMFNSITNVTKVTVNSKYLQNDFFSKEIKNSQILVDRSVKQEIHGKTGLEMIQKLDMSPGYSRRIKDFEKPSTSKDKSISKVTIEELDEYDIERKNKRIYPDLTRKSITDTIKDSECKSSQESLNAVNGNIDNGKNREFFRKIDFWICSRCTLENQRWRITCAACDMWRPTVCEYKKSISDNSKVNDTTKNIIPEKKNNETLKNKELDVNLQNEIDTNAQTKLTITQDSKINETKIIDNKYNRIGFVNEKESIVSNSIEKKINMVERKDEPKLIKITKINEEDINDEFSSSKKGAENQILSKSFQNSKKEQESSKNIIVQSKSEESTSPKSNDKLDCDKIQINKADNINEEEKNIKHSKLENDTKTIDEQNKAIRAARIAFFEKTLQDITPNDSKSNQSTSEIISMLSPNEKIKLKDKLREMKNSLPKHRKEKCQRNAEDNSENNKTAEVYLIKSEKIIEKIKVKRQPEKVSSSSQTSAQIKKVMTPIIVEDHVIDKNGKITTTISKDVKSIDTDKFQLMRAKDFADIKAMKTGVQDGLSVHFYANVSNNESEPIPSTSKILSPPASRKKIEDATDSLNVRKSNKNMNTIAVNRLLKKLESAIANGKDGLAGELAKELAQLKVTCLVTRQKPDDKEITVNMYVEDKARHRGPIPLRISPTTTVLELKQKIEKDYEIPVDVQRWILGKQLASNDSLTLFQMGIDTEFSPIFLYLVSPEVNKNIEEVKVKVTLDKILKDATENDLTENVHGRPLSAVAEEEEEEENLEKNKNEEVLNNKNEIQKENTNFNELNKVVKQENQDNNVTMDKGTLIIGWKCETCTLINKPTRPGCAACSAARPDNYNIPEEHKKKAIELAEEEDKAAEAAKEEYRLQNYQKLVDLEKDELVLSMEAFECPVCLVDYKPMEGVILRECLHTFCKDCLSQTVRFSDDAEVKCPFRNNSYTCDSVLLEREIKALVTPELYEEHLAKSVALAENKIENAFHCKTPDCNGWCIYEDNVNTFWCPVCTHTNCLTCQAIHEGLNCKLYQDQLNRNTEGNLETKRTKEMLQEMVGRGEAMNCPTCQVVLMKKWGCDWLRCSMCRTEICWVTRGPRWGPNGKGDTSAGCQCGANGVKCHPKCNYCH